MQRPVPFTLQKAGVGPLKPCVQLVLASLQHDEFGAAFRGKPVPDDAAEFARCAVADDIEA